MVVDRIARMLATYPLICENVPFHHRFNEQSIIAYYYIIWSHSCQIDALVCTNLPNTIYTELFNFYAAGKQFEIDYAIIVLALEGFSLTPPSIAVHIEQEGTHTPSILMVNKKMATHHKLASRMTPKSMLNPTKLVPMALSIPIMRRAEDW